MNVIRAVHNYPTDPFYVEMMTRFDAAYGLGGWQNMINMYRQHISIVPYHGEYIQPNEQEWLIEPTGLLGWDYVQQQLQHNPDGHVAQLHQLYECLRAFGVQNHEYFNALYDR